MFDGQLTPPRSPSLDEDGDGCSLVDEMEMKYLCGEEDVEEEPLMLNTLSGMSPCKLACDRHLELLVLNRRKLNRVGDLDRLAAMVRHVTELDLAWNSLRRWSEVALLMRHIPHLRICNLSHNPLDRHIDNDHDLPTSPRLSSLVLNGTELPWCTLMRVLSVLPRLEELHLSLNDYSSSQPEGDQQISAAIHRLHLNGCQLQDWGHVLQICRAFPCIESLFLAQNPLAKIDGGDTTTVLSCLLSLNLNKCVLNNWESIEQLAQMPLLSELRIAGNPLPAGSDDERRHFLLASLPGISSLNGSSISDDQRIQAERYFVRYHQCRNDKPQRYWNLVGIHGQLEQLVNVDLRPRTQAEVRLWCEETGVDRLIRVGLAQNVGSLKKHLEGWVGIPAARMRIFYVDMDLVEGFGPAELRFPKQMLHALQIQDGDQLHVQAKQVARTRRRTYSDKDNCQQQH